MNEPAFLTREAVDLIHTDSLREFGGGEGLRDENALESALAQPMNEFLLPQEAQKAQKPGLNFAPFVPFVANKVSCDSCFSW